MCEAIMAGATESQLRLAIVRAQCVDLYRQEKAAREGNGLLSQWQPRFIEWLARRYPHVHISQPTLYRWLTLYQSSLDLHKLLDTRGGDRRSPASKM
jgi:hypothetical protein